MILGGPKRSLIISTIEILMSGRPEATFLIIRVRAQERICRVMIQFNPV